MGRVKLYRPKFIKDRDGKYLFNGEKEHEEYLKLKKVQCSCGVPIRWYELEGPDGSDIVGVCANEPDHEYRALWYDSPGARRGAADFWLGMPKAMEVVEHADTGTWLIVKCLNYEAYTAKEKAQRVVQ
jgi:hypothetical protein